MSKFTTNWLATMFTQHTGVVNDHIEIDEVFTDSRQKSHFGLFIPIEGDRFDGHEFLKDAIQKGAIAALWNKEKDIPSFLPTDFPLFFVEDTVKAMQHLALAYREKVNPKVIGITGSNGKTTTKDLFANVLGSTFKTWKTNGNFNNHIGLPLTILQMEQDTEVLILEMGMNHFGEIETLTNIAKPDIAVITNIGESHIEYLGSREGIAKAKSEIVDGLKHNGILILDGDEPLLHALAAKQNSRRIGFDPENDQVIKKVQLYNDHTSFQLGSNHYSIPLLGKHQAKNASYAIVAAQFLGVSDDKITSSLNNVELTGMRFEKINTNEGAILINDAYNASATSMKASIEVVKDMEANRRILVLGDILELGEFSKSIHQSVADVITPPIDAVYTYGEQSEEIIQALKERDEKVETYSFHSQERLTDQLRNELSPQNIILFKASRGMKLEKVIDDLQDRS
ncbi:UDP-N-acetylmuramoyl-tripeptide--D-alanyl-D-alanine ligase [Salinibacillus xinjiangensis]|uniref:UDP-N-acetylmuramoyl-tripeptide--D-alanyl-D-alanine ligase n=1 Tax=Salinibacillus xinjiangensis TaxID=1229268 RepID=A0A6G1X3K7_9BACI|nr:UDP-N-acetylmuramoyl-tripeptide--D-alanyl-D-alanine ligase [Salinibacillus xinjiangensis]MRG85495.1 UDP-N-acetylmuramoyl-tripeptide--D-alanyl-D-alanine ligase [Salinibacillus xinjiangensis]